MGGASRTRPDSGFVNTIDLYSGVKFGELAVGVIGSRAALMFDRRHETLVCAIRDGTDRPIDL